MRAAVRGSRRTKTSMRDPAPANDEGPDDVQALVPLDPLRDVAPPGRDVRQGQASFSLMRAFLPARSRR